MFNISTIKDVNVKFVIALFVSVVISLVSWQISFLFLFMVFIAVYNKGDVFTVFVLFVLVYLRMILFKEYENYGDFYNRYEDYLSVFYDYDVIFESNFGYGEYMPIIVDNIIVFIFGKITIDQFAVVWFLFVITGLIFMIERLSRFMRAYIFCFVLFFDFAMAFHLGWQCMSTFIIMIYLMDYWYGGKIFNVYKFLFFMGLLFMIHASGLIFLPLSLIVINKVSSKKLKVYVLLCLLLGSTIINMDLIREILRQTHGVPILSKMYFAVIAEENLGININIRMLFAISLMLSFFVKSEDMLYRLYLFYGGLFLLFMQIPILDIRIGYIAYSFLVGIPFALFYIKYKPMLLRCVS